jgi:pimeloyl-ACP methyl ester carboxylesterase
MPDAGSRDSQGDRGATFVLVHGGGHGAWSWDGVLPLLRAPAIAVDLPGRGARPADLSTVTMGECVDAVVNDIVERDLHGVILVGHSLAGVTVPAVAARLPRRVRHLVLVAGFVPPEGCSVVDTLPFGLRQLTRMSLPRSATRRMPALVMRHTLCNDMAPTQARAVLARIGPDAPALMGHPVSRAGLPDDLPRTYVRFTRDRNLSARKAGRMAANLGCTGAPIEIDAGHDGIISRPDLVAAVLNGLLVAETAAPPRPDERESTWR